MTTPKSKFAGLAFIAALCAGFALGLTALAWAGVEEGVEAYDRGDYAKAFREWRPLAEQGDAKAQFNLGGMYRQGRGVPQDDAEAMKWYRKAAEQGDAKAQGILGFMYDDGQGVAQDYAEAVKWYRKAAGQGYAQAQYNLGLMYYDGQGVSQDYVQAHMWSNLAAAKGDKTATKNRDIIAGVMTPTQLAEAQRLARAWRPRKQVAAASSRPDAGGATDNRRRIAGIQRGLASLGYDPGPADGILGPKTRAAVRAFRIQLGSLDSATAAAAEWRRLRRRHRDLLEALRPRVQRADLGAKGVFYRLQAGPLADAGRAKGLCETLARRNVPCLVITP